MSSTCRLEELLLMRKPVLPTAKTASSARQSMKQVIPERQSLPSIGKGDAPVRLVVGNANGNRERRRYACLKCPYSTDRRDLFTRHENIHRDEKPFRCYVCNKMFNRADHVKKHFLRIHKGLEYDVKLTKRIKGVDYYTENLPTSSTSDPIADKSVSAAALTGGCMSEMPASTQSLFTSQLVNLLIDTSQQLSPPQPSSSPHPACVPIFTSTGQFPDVVSENRSAISSQFSLFQVHDDVSQRELLYGKASKKPTNVTQNEDAQTTGCVSDDKAVDTVLRMETHKDLTSDARDDEETSSLSSPSPTLSLSSPSSFEELPKQGKFPDRSSPGDRMKGNSRSTRRSRDGIQFDIQAMKSLAPSAESDLNTEHECEVCGCAFADFPSLHTHRYLLHRHVSKAKMSPPYRCVFCGHHATSQRNIIQHMFNHYTRGQVSCDSGNGKPIPHFSNPMSRRKQSLPRKVVKTQHL